MIHIAFIFATFLALTANAGVFVGNGGEGVIQSDGSIQLRDLYEAEIPEVNRGGAAVGTHPEVRARVESLSLLSDEPELKVQLLDFLSQLEARESLAGVILAEFMTEYHWLVTSLPLTPMTDDSSIAIDPSRRVLLANRLQRTVRLNKMYWGKLSPFQKLGLVLHEMVSAGFRLHCQAKICNQSSLEIREAIAELLAPQGHALYRQNTDLLLKINTPHLAPPQLCRQPTEEVSITMLNGTVHRFAKSEILQASKDICGLELQNLSQILFQRKQFKPLFESYQTRASDGREYSQEYLRVEEFKPMQRFAVESAGDWQAHGDDCTNVVAAKLNRWFSYDPVSNPAVFSCSEH